jgi:hypothetical protein
MYIPNSAYISLQIKCGVAQSECDVAQLGFGLALNRVRSSGDGDLSTLSESYEKNYNGPQRLRRVCGRLSL